LVLGLFGITEIVRNLEKPERRSEVLPAIGRLWPTRAEFKLSWPASVRGTLIGSLLGVLPGGGGILATFASYSLEKRLARDPSRFGKGAIEGVAAPESANNAAAQTSYIPLLTLGLPANPIMAIMMGAMIIHGIAPGTAVMQKRPDLFWGLVASMWIANLMLLVINLPLIGIWVKLVQIPYRLLFPSIVLLCCIGVYTINNSAVDIIFIVFFTLLGALAIRFGCEPAPLILAFVLGQPMEENFRRALALADGNPMVFVQRPISLALVVCAAIVLIAIVVPQLRRTRDSAFEQ
jgi:TctA family transporter